MNPVKDYHVSANNPYISHLGPRDICDFRDCIAHRVRYVVLTETAVPSDDVVRLQAWLMLATDAELKMARLVADERNQLWAKEILDRHYQERLGR